MAWSWSHTAEAYRNAEANLYEIDTETLQEIYAEWCAHRADAADSDFSEEHYTAALDEARKLDNETLAVFIWERASEQATCDNGGWNAWLYPYGCHTVSFDLED